MLFHYLQLKNQTDFLGWITQNCYAFVAPIRSSHSINSKSALLGYICWLLAFHRYYLNYVDLILIPWRFIYLFKMVSSRVIQFGLLHYFSKSPPIIGWLIFFYCTFLSRWTQKDGFGMVRILKQLFLFVNINKKCLENICNLWKWY